MEDDSSSELFVLGKINNDPNCKSKMPEATNKKRKTHLQMFFSIPTFDVQSSK